MTPAELARQNAIPLELKKDGLFQRQSGDWVLRFVVQASDMNEQLMRAAMGTRFQAALVEVNDDESPVQQPAKELPVPEPHSGRASWRDLQPAAQCAIRIQDPLFKAFFAERIGWKLKDGDTMDDMAKSYLVIKSKTELNTDHKKRMLWKQLDDAFQAWKLADVQA